MCVCVCVVVYGSRFVKQVKVSERICFPQLPCGQARNRTVLKRECFPTRTGKKEYMI